MTENEIKDLFREMREDPVPEDSLSRMRSMLESRMRSRARWKAAAWVMATAAVVLIAILLQPWAARRNSAIPMLVASRVDLLPLQLPSHLSPVTVTPTVRHLHRRVEPPLPPVEIRIETSDPDVVILLMGQ